MAEGVAAEQQSPCFPGTRALVECKHPQAREGRMQPEMEFLGLNPHSAGQTHGASQAQRVFLWTLWTVKVWEIQHWWKVWSRECKWAERAAASPVDPAAEVERQNSGLVAAEGAAYLPALAPSILAGTDLHQSLGALALGAWTVPRSPSGSLCSTSLPGLSRRPLAGRSIQVLAQIPP